jgi:hypothetical protein
MARLLGSRGGAGPRLGRAGATAADRAGEDDRHRRHQDDHGPKRERTRRHAKPGIVAADAGPLVEAPAMWRF